MIDKILKLQETALFSQKVINFTETKPQIISGAEAVGSFENLKIFSIFV